MIDEDLLAIFAPLYDDISSEPDFTKESRLLAHYTSLATLENILKGDEIWFSNPLLMNDYEEVRFGVLQGTELALESGEIADACGSTERAEMFRELFGGYKNRFEEDDAFDTYVFCLSEHLREDNDGILSMWRGYGGNGSGVAIVIDSANVAASNDSPLIFSRVHYATGEQRRAWIKELNLKFATILREAHIPDDKLYVAAYALFDRIKTFSLFSKHSGFSEEKEWRVVYTLDRDRENRMKPMLQYFIGKNGAEPKLKLKIGKHPDAVSPTITLETIIDRIILGPSLSSPLARKAVARMLDKLDRSALNDRVRSSEIPFRHRD